MNNANDKEIVKKKKKRLNFLQIVGCDINSLCAGLSQTICMIIGHLCMKFCFVQKDSKYMSDI